jgi:hypothetical protein
VTRLGMGIDVARFGRDLTVMACIEWSEGAKPPLRLRAMREYSKLDTMSVASRFESEFEPQHGPADATLVDVVGLGAGVYDRLREGRLRDRVFPFTSGEAPKGRTPAAEELARKRFMNWKAQAASYVGEVIVKGELAIPHHRGLMAELNAWTGAFSSSGKVRVVDPEDSPDHADAVMMALWAAVMMRPKVWVGA